MSSKPEPKGKSKNEGEGSRTAARDYNKDTRDFVKTGKVDESAEKARKAVDGDEAKDLKRAEKQGMKPARH